MNSRWRRLAAPALLLALTAGFYWKLTVSPEYTWLESPDQSNQVRPWLDYEARELHAGRMPLWTPYEWGGQSLIGQAQPGLVNPLNWILFAMPLTGGHIPLRTLHWYWVLIHWLGAVFCYLLCRDLKAGMTPSILGACVFALTGFMGHTDWPQIMMSAIWAPVVLLFFARTFRGEQPRASAALCGAALGMSYLSGHHQVGIFLTVILGGLWLWHLATGTGLIRKLGHALLFGVVWLSVASAQILPAVEYARHAVRWAGTPEPLRWNEPIPYSVHAQYGLGLFSIPGMVIPGLELHANPFVGIVGISFALVAIGLGGKRREVRLFAVVAVSGLLLALAGATPLYRVVYTLVPMVEKARNPAMIVVLAQLGIAVLAALGLELWRQGARSRIVPLAVAALAGMVFWFGLDSRATVVAGVGMALGVIMAVSTAPSRSRLGLKRTHEFPLWIVVALFLVEAAVNAPRLGRLDRPGGYQKTIQEQSDIAGFLKHQPGWFRVEVDDAEIPYNFGDWHGIEEFGSQVSSMPENTFHVLGHAETPRMFGIRYRVARKPSDAAQVEVFTSRTGLKVFENPQIHDPLWVFREAPCAGADRFQIASRTPGRMAFGAQLGCDGLVVTGDPFARGWQVIVDGRRAVVQEVYGMQAVRAQAGSHRIEFRYRPASVYWGAGLAILGLLLTAAVVTFR